MDFIGEWISEEGHTFIISDCNRNTISGKLILKYDYDMIDSKFNGVILINGLDRIDFCFWIFSIWGAFGMLVLFTAPESFANETSVTAINDELALEKTTLAMNIPKDST